MVTRMTPMVTRMSQRMITLGEATGLSNIFQSISKAVLGRKLVAFSFQMMGATTSPHGFDSSAPTATAPALPSHLPRSFPPAPIIPINLGHQGHQGHHNLLSANLIRRLVPTCIQIFYHLTLSTPRSSVMCLPLSVSMTPGSPVAPFLSLAGLS